MLDVPARQPAQRPWIVLVLVTPKFKLARGSRHDTEQARHLQLARARIRSAYFRLHLCATSALAIRHATAASQLRVGQPIDEVALRTHHLSLIHISEPTRLLSIS